MKWPILLAAAACVMPVTAHAQRELSETAGDWELHGLNGECVILKRVDTALISIATPAPDGHDGGLVVALREMAIPDGEPAMLDFRGKGRWNGQHPMVGVGNISGFWTPFPGPRTIDDFPDSWRVTVTHRGKVVSDISITGFDAVRAAMWRCVEKTR